LIAASWIKSLTYLLQAQGVPPGMATKELFVEEKILMTMMTTIAATEVAVVMAIEVAAAASRFWATCLIFK
jgi:hypothetical protein